jgi:hypothetical protein
MSVASFGVKRLRARICIGAALQEPATKLTEDPPFGGLWCDQPAIFLCGRFASGLRLHFRRFTFEPMDGTQLAGIHQALVAVQHAVTSMTFSNCDKDDVIELIDRVESELHASHPNVPVMCTFLNSIARSLRNQPEAREACLVIEDAIEGAGLPSTWQSGI